MLFRSGAYHHSAGRFATNGDSQCGRVLLRARSTGGTAVRLTSDGAPLPTAYNIANYISNSVIDARLLVAARDTTTSGSATWSWNYFHINTGNTISQASSTTTPLVL